VLLIGGLGVGTESCLNPSTPRFEKPNKAA
jgi:hypothetical protein